MALSNLQELCTSADLRAQEDIQECNSAGPAWRDFEIERPQLYNNPPLFKVVRSCRERMSLVGQEKTNAIGL